MLELRCEYPENGEGTECTQHRNNAEHTVV